jgi:cytochrome c553
MMTRALTAAFVICTTLVFGSPVSAADIDAGKAKATQICQSCHGLDGNSATPDYPKLGGQASDYMSKALRDYKSGARKNPIMAAMAGALSAQQIEDVAAYYAVQPQALVLIRNPGAASTKGP